jgi:hypothetical protein
MGMEEHPELTPTQARQGRKAPMVRRVLIISVIAAAVLLAMMMFFMTP